MFKVLLQYLIPWCILTAILLHLRTLLGEVSENQGMASTGLYMEYLESRNSGKYRMFEGDPAALKEHVKDDQRTARRNIDTGSEQFLEYKLKLEEINLHTSVDQDEQVTTKRTLTEITVHSSQQHITIDLCLIFAYHIASKETFTERTFFATMALLFWKVSALPLNQPGSEEKKKTKHPTIVHPKHKSKVRRAPDTQSQFSQGNCQSEWFQNEDSCYRLFPGKMNYDSASEHCSSLQAKLVMLETKEENTFVDQLGNEFHSDGFLWTGVQILCKNCSDTGRYVNWYPGQPDQRSNCVVMVSTGRWKNFDCNYMFAFVCEKEPSKLPYSRKQLLLALLVPICSCLTLAVTFTTLLLVSSLRRGNQPFQLSSRYGRTKRPRKIATWEMIETIRRASLHRASLRRGNSRHRGETSPAPRCSIPNIEITLPDGGKGAKSREKSKQANGKTNSRVMLWRKGKASKPRTFLEAPTDRRRSSGTGSNSSLYELLVVLNRMDFEPEKDGQNVEVVEMKRRDVDRAGETSAGDGEVSGEDREKLVARSSLTDDEGCGRKQSFQNMAFRDSAASVETSAGGAGIAITSLDPGKGTLGQKDTGENSSVEKAAEKHVTGKDTRGKGTQGKESQGKDSGVISRNAESNSVRINSHAQDRVVSGDDFEMSENTKVVKVDVHRTSENSTTKSDRVVMITDLDPENDTPEKTSRVRSGDGLETGEHTKVVKVDVHRTSKSDDSPTSRNRVAMITALDAEKDGESNCVELQSRAPDRVSNSDEMEPSDELEASEKTKIVKVAMERISKDEDSSASGGSIETNNNEKRSSKGNVLWIYSI